MKQLLLVCLVSFAFSVNANELAGQCSDDICNIRDNCRCSSNVNPLGDLKNTPQLVSLTFVEAVTDDIFTKYWSPLLFSRNNPDDAPIGATFFVPHEYTDYKRVNDLYNYGFEIGVHSITKNNLQSYWRQASEELLEQEFGGAKQIISRFANIPAQDIQGVRTPQLQLAGNFSIRAFMKSNLTYDSSWPTVSTRPLFPYTLDYNSTQQCSLGAECPNESFKGFWVIPINNIEGYERKECNTLSSCGINGTADHTATWLLDQIKNVRSTTRVPITLIVESHWFDQDDQAFKALNKVLDELEKMDDVFLVSLRQVLDWIKNPVPLDKFATEQIEDGASCRPVMCELQTEKEEMRYMTSCVPCPKVYPWLGNPNGDQK